MAKKKVAHLKDKKFGEMVKSLRSVDTLYELIAFIFAFRMKELLIVIVIVLVVINYYPKAAEFILNLFK